MPRHTPHAHWWLLVLTAAVMTLVYAWESTRQRELQAPVPVVQPDVWGEVRKEIQRRPWVDPMQPRGPDMPGGLK